LKLFQSFISHVITSETEI